MDPLWVIIFAVALLCKHIDGYIPPKWSESKEDRTKYCGVCQNAVINIQRYLLAQTTGAGIVDTGRMDSKGNRKRRLNNHFYGEELVTDAMDWCCTDESRFPKSSDRKMCEYFVRDYEDQLIEMISKNDRMQMRRFCRQKVSKEDCDSISFPDHFLEQMDLMKSLRAKAKPEL